MKSDAINNQANAPESASIDTTMLSVLAHDLVGVLRYHQLMGIETYPFSSTLKQMLQPVAKLAEARGGDANSPADTVPVSSEVSQIWKKHEAGSQLHLLQEEIKACQRCSASGICQGIVPGRGQAGASLLVLGDYSLQEGLFSTTTLFGSEEDTMLWNMMRAIGLTSAEVYVTNVVKCCPRSPAQPSDADAQHCREHLLREIAVVRPKVLCAMGETAAHALVDSQASIFQLRGRLYPYRENRLIQVMVTLHPRLLLKNAALKKAAWHDLQMMQRLLQTM